MAEIEITLPTVQYGNVKVRVTPEEFGMQYGVDNPYALGMGAATYLNLFTQGFAEGARMDVSAPQGASEKGYEELAQANAQELLDEGLGGVTELPGDDSMPPEEGMRLAAEAGQRDADKAPYPNDEITPPWEGEPAVAPQPKPWETEGW